MIGIYYLVFLRDPKNNDNNKSLKVLHCKIEGVSLPTRTNSLETNEDWRNWVVLHGNLKEVEDDEFKVGKIIGVQCKNMFQVLSRGKSGEEKEDEAESCEKRIRVR